MFPYACGYFPDKRLKFLSLKNAPKLMLGCIVSNCGTQASKTVFRQISTCFLQSDHCVQIGQVGRSKWPRGRSLHLTTVFKRLWGAVKSDRPSIDWPRFPCCPDAAPKTNKGFRQHPICQNPLFSAVFPIFCSCHLYQLSSLHFGKVPNIGKTFFPCVVL